MDAYSAANDDLTCMVEISLQSAVLEIMQEAWRLLGSRTFNVDVDLARSFLSS